jgi:hypothetical protein
MTIASTWYRMRLSIAFSQGRMRLLRRLDALNVSYAATIWKDYADGDSNHRRPNSPFNCLRGRAT